MQKFFKSRKVKIIAALLAVLLLGMMAAAVSANASSPVTKAVGVVFAPLQAISSYIADSFDNFSGRFASSSYYMDKIDELELELAKYREQLVDYEKIKQQLDSYENFLEVKEDFPDFEFAPATVIGRDAADLFHSFVINKGSSSGIEVNDPVIFGRYLVGVVKEVNLTTSTVRTILDPSVSISAYEIRSHEDGYISNTAELAIGGKCKLSGLDRATGITPGGMVCTSGIGEIFPRDLIIGTVSEIKNQETDISAYAVVEPGVDFANLIDVFVITSFLGQVGAVINRP